MDCPECGAYVVDLLEIDLGKIWKGPRICYRQVWRLFPCGHQCIAEDTLIPSG